MDGDDERELYFDPRITYDKCPLYMFLCGKSVTLEDGSVMRLRDVYLVDDAWLEDRPDWFDKCFPIRHLHGLDLSLVRSNSTAVDLFNALFNRCMMFFGVENLSRDVEPTEVDLQRLYRLNRWESSQPALEQALFWYVFLNGPGLARTLYANLAGLNDRGLIKPGDSAMGSWRIASRWAPNDLRREIVSLVNNGFDEESRDEVVFFLCRYCQSSEHYAREGLVYDFIQIAMERGRMVGVLRPDVETFLQVLLGGDAQPIPEQIYDDLDLDRYVDMFAVLHRRLLGLETVL